MNKDKLIIERLLDGTGITINGNLPFDLQIHDERFYGHVLQKGSLGLGEAYMNGWWDCEKLDVFFCTILEADLDKKIKHDWSLALKIAWNRFLNPGRKSRAFDIGKYHYDLGNDLYKVMLDERLTYTCGYWREASNLNQAQEDKLGLVCRKIGLKPGQKILDIGSGWGSFIGYAANEYGAKAIGITVSKKQKEFADMVYENTMIETRLQDYRDINEKFDHIVSLGMFEHVGYKNYRTFMQTVHNALQNNGLFLLHTIGGNISVKDTDAWSEKYIFPGSMLPSIKQIGESIEGLFVVEDWHNFGADYDKTLMAWYQNFNRNWYLLKSMYDSTFYRMWKYYLLSCAGSFRARKNQLWQLVLSKKGIKGGYQSIR